VADGLVTRQGLVHRRHGHQPRLDEADRILLARVQALLRPAGLRPPIVGELATQLALPLAGLREFLARMAAQGQLVAVAPNRWYLPETVDQLAAHALALAGESADGGCDAAAYRDRTGIGRNLTVQVLEFLDRAGITRFDGRLHRPLEPRT
jgi:selenocysteine-specific elongation factor